MILFFLLCFLIISASLSLPMHPRAILGYLKPKYSKFVKTFEGPPPTPSIFLSTIDVFPSDGQFLIL